ncbi:serine O-acetyltransferase EpsC [Lysinibacillus endophyticus]|uniref:Serine acetyltransferase n=1 Tax=Ureibacillus endophyticus TaxID=1978490 RepID=A0A494Z7D7_9BACL|nr:serine O-acetyltransferase EpsC [Lysinibacillus endophyticus]MCP1145017.1 serine acetyltransferase [Lysinibacillus endophyticus]RKQ18444.1 serine acetyltransferase [Lysinibacillus endophyticus]
MKLKEWLNSEVPNIASELIDVHNNYFSIEKSIGFEGQETIYKILQNFRSALFPCLCDKYSSDETKINISIGNNLRKSSIDLSELIEKVLANESSLNEADSKRKAEEIVISLIKKFPEIRRMLQTDIQAAYNGDPATTSTEEILYSYPSIQAISIHRIAHELYNLNVPIIPRIMNEYAHRLTGIDIHPGASIGEYFFIDHGTGVVIGETCTIGKNVKIYQGVTLGAKSFPLDEHGNPIKGIKRHPNIEDNVVIYAGATILGGDTTIGKNSVIGGNIWLTQSVPENSRVYNSQPLPNIK